MRLRSDASSNGGRTDGGRGDGDDGDAWWTRCGGVPAVFFVVVVASKAVLETRAIEARAERAKRRRRRIGVVVFFLFFFSVRSSSTVL